MPQEFSHRTGREWILPRTGCEVERFPQIQISASGLSRYALQYGRSQGRSDSEAIVLQPVLQLAL